MSRSIETTAVDALRQRLVIVEKRCDTLWSRARRRAQFVVAMAVALVLLTAVVAVMYFQRGDSRAYYNQRIHQLVCSVQPGSIVADQLRGEYSCPAYQQPTPFSPDR